MIDKEIEIVQSLIDNLKDDNAVKISVYLPEGKVIDYYWNENSFLKSALKSELRHLILESLNI